MYGIPWLAFFLLWAVLVRYGMRVRVAFLAAQVVNGVLIVFATEVLSVFRALTAGPLAVFWSVVVLVNLALLWRDRGIAPWIKGFSDRRATARLFASWSALELGILAAVGLIVAVTAVIALVAPPNNYDSMIYHMSRVAHWAYNGTVANYPVTTLMQLVIPPYNAYAILQTYILSGSDYFANLVQWNSMVSSLIGVSLMVELLGGNRRAQLFGVLCAATLPTGILQASSTQNDYVATLWAVGVAVFALLLITTGRWRWAVLCALSFGLATFTKGIAVILSLPFLVWAVGKVRWPLARKAGLVLLAAGVVAALNSGFMQRQFELSPQPFSHMAQVAEATVDRVDVHGILSNAVRGVATELALPSTEWNNGLIRAVEEVHRWLGISPGDRRYLFGSRFVLWYSVPVIEDLAASPVQSLVFLLVLAGLVAGAVRGRRREGAGKVGEEIIGPGAFAGVFLVAVVLFCAFVKWQAWIPRFHLPFFVLFSAVAGVVMERWAVRLWLPVLAGVWMLAAALVPLFCNQLRPLLPAGAVTRSALAQDLARGGEIFDWLQQNGYFQEKSGGKGFLNVVTNDMRLRLQEAYPAEYEEVWRFLTEDGLSFSRGIFFTPQEELLFGRFGKIVRDDMAHNIRFMRQQLDRSPGCRDVGLLSGRIEYPFWRLLDRPGRPVRIEHILVGNVSGQLPYPRGEPEPCLILREGNDGPGTVIYKGKTYLRCTPGPMQVYVEEHR